MAMMPIFKTFRFRLEPNTIQRQHFGRFAGCTRFVFNYALAAGKEAYERSGKLLSYNELCKKLTQLRNADETAWLKDVHSQVLQQALKDLQTAYEHFFRRLRDGQVPGFPKFKKKGRKDSFRYPQSVKVKGARVYLPKIGWVRFRESRPIEGKILQATIKREGDHWFVCFACEVDSPAPKSVPVKDERTVGIDVGLKKFAVLSDGTEIENPRFLAESLAQLRRAQRTLSRKVKFSKNWAKQVIKVARLHARVKNCRKDFCHKLSTSIVKSHDVIVVEDLHIKGLVKNRCVSRAISDVGWGLFLGMVKYKAEWAGKHFVQIGRFEATSQMCSTCGEKKPMPLSVRTYACDGCGMVKDRDWNASLNIRAAGLVVLNACGGA